MFQTYLAVALGVLLAVLWPVLRGFVSKEFLATAGGPPRWLVRYGGLLVFCLATALLALALWRQANPQAAEPGFLAGVLIGFGWEASVEKFLTPTGRVLPSPDLGSQASPPAGSGLGGS